MRRYLGPLARRTAFAVVIGALLLFAPIQSAVPAWVLDLQMPLAVIILVCLAGKALYDTFFYDRYLP